MMSPLWSVPSRTRSVRLHAFAFGQVRFQARAHGVLVRVRLEFLQFGDDGELIEQFVDPLAGGGAGFDERRIAAHVVGQHAQAVKLLPRAVDVGAGHIDLVDGDDERNAGGLGMADRFFGLRHDAVVGGDHDDGDIGHLGAAGTHLRERLMARRIEERDRLAAVLDAPGADHLRDAPRLGGDDVAAANLVEQRRFAVIDVPHDGDDRGPQHQVFRIVGRVDRVDVFSSLDRRGDRPSACSRSRRRPVRPYRLRSTELMVRFVVHAV